MWRRGLKQSPLEHIPHPSQVASHVEAWIETERGEKWKGKDYVASHVEAWIETHGAQTMKSSEVSRLPCGGVD